MASRPRTIAAAAATLALALLSGCGAAAHSAGTSTASTSPAVAAAPAGWRSERTPGGLVLPYPGGWRPVHGDAGTLSAAERTPDGGYLGYLNVTPRQGAERRANWVAFRLAHNRQEGDRAVRLLGSMPMVQLRAGPASCVRDLYTTITGARYVELACLAEGTHPVVLLGAAPPRLWREQAQVIARAISSAQA